MNKLFFTFMATLMVAIFTYGFCPKPEIKTFTTYSSAFFDSQDHLLRITLAEDDRYRIYQTLDQVSPHLISATILYEDQNFYDHSGVDYLALLRAFWTTYISKNRRVGASTIAMQVARLRWSIPSHTIKGKVQQILRAIQLSRHYSKKQILETHLNLAPYGRNIEGIAAASLIYFNKKPDQLSLPEALTLAVIPQNPNNRNPTTKKGYKRLSVARANLLQRWLKKFPKDRDKKKYFEMPLNVRSPETLPFLAPHFVNSVNQKISRWDSGYINTTLDMNLQNKLEGIVKNYVSSKSPYGINNASALLINYQTMEVKAMIGSVDFNNADLQGQVNGVLAKRSPGSTLKPFVYALAIDEGLVHPMTLMKDSPSRFGGFTPENYDKRFLGPIVVKDALIESRNVPAVFLQSKLKQKTFYDFLKDAEISGLKDESFYGLALALGGGEVTMMELVTLYAGLANKGVFQDIKSIKQQKSNYSKKLLSAEASFLVLDMLKDNPEPDVLNFDLHSQLTNDIAWKTGTSWAFRDAWSVGVTGPYVLAVWVGNFDGSGNHAFVGRTAAGPLLFSIFDAVFPDQGWKVESLIGLDNLNLKKVKVCRNTGDLLSQHCPSSLESWFIPGVSPIKVSNIYRAIPIEKNTGLRACWHEAGKTEMKVFEFWPSDFLQIFHHAGISLKTPPKYSEKCSLEQSSSTGQIPVITSPQNTIEYVLRSDNQAEHKIPFSAVVDPDVEDVFWFVNGKYEGKSTKGKSFIWNATNGEFKVRVVDDAGRAASSVIKVIQIQ
ncbi:MAG: penicillin-binding protein 1C [Methylococcales bacterium]|nr:penicillin-binding protein 1C [Methylococcales bacterium]